ncbi:Protein of unknown function [Pyronema omphalodes CBS 100304]|uniref:Uncharacterized protein n=1 Tax=Pyronema omphalodes (strain CBS 100304) TaxID=1076935 RepID=U4LQR2_PYROM|nr:Protein of unknown function [Pyronema omphalodes CBS 100304]
MKRRRILPTAKLRILLIPTKYLVRENRSQSAKADNAA